MSNKKRRFSPSLSSGSSSTPAPVIPLGQSSSLTTLPSLTDGLVSVPGPSRASATPAPAPVPVKEERTVAKVGPLVQGSGDGAGYGDECFSWTDLPMNKQGYRYAPCAPSPTLSPSSIHPFYRTLPGPPPTPPVHISWLDRSQFLRLDPIALTASTDRGYRSARGNVPVRSGSWYYEVYVERGSGHLGAGGGTGGDLGNAHVRVGWGRREANLDAPVGMDGYSYAIRDVGGEMVHLSRPKPYGQTFGTGDIVGCLITLPARREDESTMKRKRIPIRFKGQLYFEMEEYSVQKEMEALVDREGKAAAAAKASADAAKDLNGDVKGKKGATTKNAKKSKAAREPVGPMTRDLPTLDGSKVEFFLNGASLDTAFTDLYDFSPLPPLLNVTPSGKRIDHAKEVMRDDGTLGYYPMISCFGRGKVRVNFGLPWLSPPPNLLARPMSERWDEWRDEERLLDERDEAENAKRLVKEMKEDEERRKAAEARLLAVRANGVGDGMARKKGKGGAGKKRKGTVLDGTPTPSSAATPGLEATPALEGTPAPSDGNVEVAEVKMEAELEMSEVKKSREGSVSAAVGTGPVEVQSEIERIYGSEGKRGMVVEDKPDQAETGC